MLNIERTTDRVCALTSSVPAADFSDIIFSKFRTPVSLSSRRFLGMKAEWVIVSTSQAFGMEPGTIFVSGSSSPTSYLVGDIIQVGSEPKMGRIAASRIIAGVECEQSCRLLASCQKQSDSMRANGSSKYEPPSVSVPVNMVIPRPAFIRSGLIYLAPESSLELVVKMRERLGSHISNSLSFLVSVCRLLITAANAPTFAYGKA